MRDAILVSIPLANVRPAVAAGVTGASLPDARAALWADVEADIISRLLPLLEGGWEIVPGTLGPQSLRLTAAPSHPLARLLAPLRRRRAARATTHRAGSVACLLVRR